MTMFTSHLPDVAITGHTISERVFQALSADPSRTVLIDGPSGREMTGAALMAAVHRLSGGLAAAGFGAGQVVALMAPNMPEFAVVFHGVLWGGGTITTLNPSYTAPEVHHQLKDSGATLLVTVPDFLPQARAGAEGTSVRQIAVIGAAEGALSLDALEGVPITAQVPVDPIRHVAVMPYSSGTTGLPKGVMLSHRNMVVNVDQVVQMMGAQKREVVIAFLPFFHIYGMNVLMNAHMVAGDCILTMPRFDLPAFLGHLQQHRARKVYVVPPVVVALAKHPMVAEYDLSHLKIVFSAAAPLGAALAQACAERLNVDVIQGYGMTELSPVSHFTIDGQSRLGSSGVLLPNLACKIMNIETGAPCATGAEGEVCIKGPSVMMGYLGNPEATARTIDAEGWLHTGDIGYVDEGGHLFITDRLKELIKFKGFQVAPAEVEAQLQSHPGVLDAAVIGAPDPEAGEVPLAFVVPKAGAEAGDILMFLKDKLAHYKQPSRIVFIDAIPKSPSGKILRRILKDRLALGEF